MPEPCQNCLEGFCPLHEFGKDANTFDLADIFPGATARTLEASKAHWRQQDWEELERARLIELLKERNRNPY
jgi:hypothetical protein